MQGRVVLNEDKDLVWNLLNDPETLKACIPGCDRVEKLSQTQYVAVVRIKIGPVAARFKGNVELEPGEAPDSYKISGQGDGGVAGLAKGIALVTLAPHRDGTLLSYDVDAQLSGRLMQMGSRLVSSVMHKLADEFFAKFAARLAPETA